MCNLVQLSDGTDTVKKYRQTHAKQLVTSVGFLVQCSFGDCKAPVRLSQWWANLLGPSRSIHGGYHVSSEFCKKITLQFWTVLVSVNIKPELTPTIPRARNVVSMLDACLYGMYRGLFRAQRTEQSETVKTL